MKKRRKSAASCFLESKLEGGNKSCRGAPNNFGSMIVPKFYLDKVITILRQKTELATTDIPDLFGCVSKISPFQR